MRARQRGDFVRVVAGAKDVEAFARGWPGSRLPAVPIWAEYHVNGDLVGVGCVRRSLRYVDERALTALVEDMQNYAACQLRLLEWHGRGRGCCIA